MGIENILYFFFFFYEKCIMYMYIIKYSVFHLFDCALRLVLRRVNHALKYIVLIIIDMYEKSSYFCCVW